MLQYKIKIFFKHFGWLAGSPTWRLQWRLFFCLLFLPRLACYHFSSAQFSRSVVSNSLRPCGLQHARTPCPLPTPRVYSDSCPLNRWNHPTISSSIIPFSSHLQSFPASGSFKWVSSSHRLAKASASVLSMNIQDWFPLGWTGWIFLQSKGLSRVFSSTTVGKHQFFSAQLSL